jgi:DNA-binding NarL/FixJ family response regulator
MTEATGPMVSATREIGTRLFISEKTVSVHVSDAMAKLGALSRYEAPASGERRGLI